MINPFKLVSVYFKSKKVVSQITTEATQMTGTQPGWKTTEFYLNIAAQIATLWGAVQGFIPPKWASIISVSGIAVYTVARTILKAVTDVKAVQATTAGTAVINANTAVVSQ